MRAGGDHGDDSFIALWNELRAEGRGLIVVSGHIGSIELLAGCIALPGVPTYGLADDSDYPELFEEINAQRQRWGIEIIPWRNLRERLRRPARAGPARPASSTGATVTDDVPVRLFGEWTTLPAGPAMLAAKTGAGDRAGRQPSRLRRQIPRPPLRSDRSGRLQAAHRSSARRSRSPTRSRT